MTAGKGHGRLHEHPGYPGHRAAHRHPTDDGIDRPWQLLPHDHPELEHGPLGCMDDPDAPCSVCHPQLWVWSDRPAYVGPHPHDGTDPELHAACQPAPDAER